MESSGKTSQNPLKRGSEAQDSVPGEEPMNVLAAPLAPTDDYQSKVFDVAMRRNTIAVLEMGVDRTMVSVKMIKEIGESLKNNPVARKLIAFLAPTVHLVRQQYKEIKSRVKLEVEEYYGAKGVDDWNTETWDKEVHKHDVLFMTPQILLDALKKDYLSIETFGFIILDECAHATGKHPYAKIMKDFYHKCTTKPKILGMTASAIIKKSDVSKNQIMELEALLDSQVYSIEVTMELQEFLPEAKQICKSHEQVYPIEDTMELEDFIPAAKQICRSAEQVYSVEDTMELEEFVPAAQLICRSVEEVYSIKDTMELEEFVPAAKQMCISYMAPHLPIKEKLESSAHEKLHVMGAPNDHLLQFNEESSQKNPMSNAKASSSRAGTTKRKEVHGSASIHRLSGTWGGELAGIVLHAHKLDFTCSNVGEKFSSFVLLLETQLDEDVGNIQVELYLRSKFVRSSVSYMGCLDLSSTQVAKAKCFQELIFNSLFGKMFVKSSSGERRFLLTTEESLWDPSNNYLLLPLEFADKAIQESRRINWSVIDSCVSVVEYLKNNPWLNSRQFEDIDKNSPVDMNDLVSIRSDANVINLVNRSVSINNLKNMVVFAIHTGKIYSIVEVVTDTSAASPFEGGLDAGYSSYSDYYKQKYKIVLKYPEQPLLRLKQGHNSHNLLVDFRNEGASGKQKSKGGHGNVVHKPQQHAYIPPELLVGTDFKTDVLKSLYLLPSLMHRMESLMLVSQLRHEISHQSLMLVSQLRHEISHHTIDLNISSSLILESLTTLRCAEGFSMERLELLGDSVLKYVVSCHLFLKYPKMHEGKLSSHRSRIISNFALHKLGVGRKLQGYIRDCAFDPRRWTAPGQRSIWPSPCGHCVDTVEVPLDEKFTSEDVKIVVGKTCDRGHRWMGSKTISDCVEALIGAYYVGGGLVAALHLMKWLGIDSEIKPSLIDDAIRVASLYTYAPQINHIDVLESKLDYKFKVRGLLLEAITHPTKGFDYCYQRLEFLGDSVLDILITRHLYETHKDIDPGELTDLRSASVNNDSFAIAAVRQNLHPHLLYEFQDLEDQISSFITTVSAMSDTMLTPDVKAPKVLGDLVESIAGAILIDSQLDMDVVWKVFKPLLSPIVTPEKLELPPTRELIELCHSLGYFIKENYSGKGDAVHAELKLQLKDALLISHGSGPNKKMARGVAAHALLQKLEKRGISSSKRQDQEHKHAGLSSSKGSGSGQRDEPHSAPLKKHKTSHLEAETKMDNSSIRSSDCKKLDIPARLEVVTCYTSTVVPPIDMKKGGARVSLYELCKKLQWPLPSFDTMEQKSRTPIKFGGDVTGFNSFESEIRLTIPEFGMIKLTGEARADKRSSFDSAALLMMHELERQGRIIIGN